MHCISIDENNFTQNVKMHIKKIKNIQIQLLTKHKKTAKYTKQKYYYQKKLPTSIVCV